MDRNDRPPSTGGRAPRPAAEWAELCRTCEIDERMLEDAPDLDELLRRIVAGCERGGEPGEAREGRVGSLVRFATRAAALAERERLGDELRRKVEAIQRAVEEHDRSRQRLDSVLAGLETALGAHEGGQPEGGRRPEPGACGGPDPRAARSPSELQQLLETLGQLSHKINNPLTSLVGRAQMLKLIKADNPQVDKAAVVIEESAQRVAAYAQELSRVVKRAKEQLGLPPSRPAYSEPGNARKP